MALVRNVDRDKARQAIVRGMKQVCDELSVALIAEGVETADEFRMLQSLGIELLQGYYFARPSFRSLPEVPGEKF